MNLEERTRGPASQRLLRPSDWNERVPSLREKTKAMYREAVLVAAEQIFATEGIRGARIQDIAKLAGVSVGTVYNHFAQKEDIVMALVMQHDAELRTAWDAQEGDPPDFFSAIRARHDRVMHFMKKHMGFYALALYEGLIESELAPASSPLSAARAEPHRRHNIRRADNRRYIHVHRHGDRRRRQRFKRPHDKDQPCARPSHTQ